MNFHPIPSVHAAAVRRAVIVAAAAGLALGGCGGDTDDDTTPATIGPPNIPPATEPVDTDDAGAQEPSLDDTESDLEGPTGGPGDGQPAPLGEGAP
jgi:hypothetical protein